MPPGVTGKQPPPLVGVVDRSAQPAGSPLSEPASALAPLVGSPLEAPVEAPAVVDPLVFDPLPAAPLLDPL